MSPISSALNAPWMPPPPQEFSLIPTRRHRNFCRIWESPEPSLTWQKHPLPRSSGITQMDDPKAVSIASVLRNLSSGAPEPTPPLHLVPLPNNTSNVNDQKSVSPIVGNDMSNQLLMVSMSPSPPIGCSQTSPTPPSSSSSVTALPFSPLSEDHVPPFYASPNHLHSPAYLQLLTDTPFPTESNGDRYMKDATSENPFIQDTTPVNAKNVPLHLLSPSLFIRRFSPAHNPVQMEPVDVLSPGPSQACQTEVLGTSKHATARCQRKRRRLSYFECEGGGAEQPTLEQALGRETGESRVQTHKLTHIGYLDNADPQSSTTQHGQRNLSTHNEKDYNLSPQKAPAHPSNKLNYTLATCKTIERKPSVTDLTEDAGSDVNDLMVVDFKSGRDVGTIQSDSTSITAINEEDDESKLDVGVIKLKPRTGRRTSSTRSKSKPKSKPKPKFKSSEQKPPATFESVIEGDVKYSCSVCKCTLNRFSDYRRHSLSNKHREACNAPKVTYECPFCDELLCRSDALKRHLTRSCRKRYDTPTSTTTTTPIPTPI